MNRIVIKHISGPKANQEDSFTAEPGTLISVGRSQQAQIRFSDDQDVVSRDHAVIEVDPANSEKLRLNDTGSRNGLFLNGSRISGSVQLNHGDRVQLGVGGPEFTVNYDPPPPVLPKETRLVGEVEAKVTREVTSDVPRATASVTVEQGQPRTVGRATVERLIGEQQTKSKKQTGVWLAVLGGLILLVGGGLFFKNQMDQRQQATEIAKTREAAESAAKREAERVAKASAMEGRFAETIAEKFGGSTVMIETSWRLVHPDTRKSVYIAVETITLSDGTAANLPVYVQWANGQIEPLLTVNDGGGRNLQVGGNGQGTGFVVAAQGFIMTNRHVAAAWLTDYSSQLPAGLLKKLDARKQPVGQMYVNQNQVRQLIPNWVPVNSPQLGQGVGKHGEGEVIVLDVTFPKTKDRIPARLVKISDSQDVALIKIDAPFELKPVELASADSLSRVRDGQQIVVLGYPAISAQTIVRTESADQFNRKAGWSVVPNVSVNPGYVQQVLIGRPISEESLGKGLVNTAGDYLQLNINASGPGNSGGPTFDTQGRVVGIFSAQRADGKLSYAIPIKYGLELMSLQTAVN